MMKRQIEIFTTGCPVCDEVTKLVEEVSCNSCEITTYNVNEQCEEKTCLDKIGEYQIKKIPAVAVDGKLLKCFEDGITKENLLTAGIGKAI